MRVFWDIELALHILSCCCLPGRSCYSVGSDARGKIWERVLQQRSTRMGNRGASTLVRILRESGGAFKILVFWEVPGYRSLRGGEIAKMSVCSPLSCCMGPEKFYLPGEGYHTTCQRSWRERELFAPGWWSA